MFTNESISSLPTFTLDKTVPILSDVDITPHMVLEKLRAIHAYKSPDPDGWPPKIIKECADTICTPLAKLYFPVVAYLKTGKLHTLYQFLKKETNNLLPTTAQLV